jgi:hypothetical protein
MEPGEGDSEAAAYQPLLEPGEQLRVHGETSLAMGSWGPAAEWHPIELQAPGWLSRFWAFATRTTIRKVVFFTLLSPLMLYAWLDSIGGSVSDGLERLVGGVVSAGPRGSTARQAQHALSALGPGANALAVTDRRLLLVRAAITGNPPERTLVMAIARTDIAGVRPRPRGLLRRRAELRFRDGSHIVLSLPVLRSPSPTRLTAALAGQG